MQTVKTNLGFKAKISKKGICELSIPRVLGLYSKSVQDTFVELWERQNTGELAYFNEIKLKKVSL
jgi:hypothetical protein